MKKFLLFFALLMPLMASADAVEINGIYYNLDVSTRTAEVTSNPNGEEYTGSITIPLSVNFKGGYSVTSIGENAFVNGFSLTSVTIPNSVTSIGEYAFACCHGLTSITIPNSVTSIRSSAFRECFGLTSIEVESGNTVYDSRNNCNAIIETATNTLITGCQNTIIPNSVTSIDNYAFRSCSGLTSVTISNSVTSIGYSAFENCYFEKQDFINNSSLDAEANNYWGANIVDSRDNGFVIKDRVLLKYTGNEISITIPNSVTSIGEQVFYNSSILTSVTIPNTVTSIGEKAFYGCSRLTKVELNSNAVASGSLKNVFGEQVKEYIIGNSVTSIGKRVFSGCSDLTSVTISNSVTSIGESAFWGCSGLTSIDIPNSVTEIGNYAFSGCSGLTSVEIPNSVTSIGSQAFYNCSGLTSVTIPNSVTSIGNSAFQYCSSLTFVTIPTSVTSIENSAFQYCSSLTSVTIPTNVTSIGEYAFQYCSGLTSVSVESGNMVYDSRGNCNAIIETATNNLITGCQNTVIPNSVTSIGNGAFSGCSGLTSIDIPSSVTLIGNSAFSGCYFEKQNFINNSSLDAETNNYWGANIVDSRDNGFVIKDGVLLRYTCNDASVTIPNSVTSIGRGAFSGYSGLTSVTIPNSVTEIGWSAFSNCSGLTSVTIPNSVTTIRGYAFEGCFGLTSVTIGQSVTSIEDAAFKSCYGLTSITIPTSVTYIGGSAFYNCFFEKQDFINNSSLDAEANNYWGATIVDSRDNGFVIKDGVLLRYSGNESSITIPNSVTSIESWAFYDRSGLTSVTIPSSVTSIIGYAFGNCSSLTSVICEATSVPSTGNNVFKNLEDVNVPLSSAALYVPYYALEDYKTTAPWSRFGTIKAFTYQDDGMYYEFNKTTMQATVISGKCEGSVEIPASIEYEEEIYSVTSIGEGAFTGCSGMTSVTIPSSVTEIGNGAFSECSGLTKVELNCNAIASKTYSSDYSLKDVFGGQVKEYVLGEGVTSIGSYAFEGCSSMTSVTIGKSVTSIGKSAFSGCSGLTKVELNSNAIASKTYTYKTNMRLRFGEQVKEYILGEDVTSIGDGAFWRCGLTSVTIPNSVISIGENAFCQCHGLTSVEIPNSVTSIEDYAFEHCSGLTSVTIGNSVTLIGICAFRGCSGLTSINIPNSVTSMGNYIFSGCSSLTSVTIPTSVTEIGQYTFRNCSSLTSVTIPTSVTDIGQYAFSGCTGLTSITIPNSVTAIGKQALGGCSGLTDVYCNAENVPTTESDAFKNTDIANATLHVQEASYNAYKTTAPWSGFGTITFPKCATPTIAFVDGKIVFDCETEDVEYVSEVSSSDMGKYGCGEIPVTATYTVSVYATKEGYANSEVVTAEIVVGGSSTSIKGDVNEDGKVNGTDIQEVINIIVKGE